MTDHQRYKFKITLFDVDHQEIKPEFQTALVHRLKPHSETVNVDVVLRDDHLIISRNDSSSLLFRRPSYCPFTNLCFQEKSSSVANNLSNSIAVGVVTLLESHDQFILLTRRASHMRTYPSYWVCPGGGIDKGETLIQAGIRELKEEVGIQVNDEETEHAETLGLWESAYPIDLNHGLPRRHHIVVYFHVRSTKMKNDINVEVDPNEVDAYTWLSARQVSVIAKQMEMTDDLKTFDVHIHSQGLNVLPFEILSDDNHNKDTHLSNGTRFALERWWFSRAAKHDY